MLGLALASQCSSSLICADACELLQKSKRLDRVHFMCSLSSLCEAEMFMAFSQICVGKWVQRCASLIQGKYVRG